MTTWRVATNHTSRDTWEQGPHHELFKEDSWPGFVVTRVEVDRTTLHIAVPYLDPGREERQPLGITHINDEAFKEKDNDDEEILGKDRSACCQPSMMKCTKEVQTNRACSKGKLCYPCIRGRML